MLVEFLKQITLNKFLASTVKRFGLYAAEYGLLNLIVPSWISTPLKFTVLSAVGTTSKGVFWWVITPRPQTATFEEPLVFIGNEDELAELDFVIVNPSESGYHLSFKTIKTKMKTTTHAVVNGIGSYAVNITLSDVVEGTGATIGSGMAAGAFVIFMGAPSLLTLPAYYLLEGPAKSFGAFCGKQAGKHLLGPKLVKPIIGSLLESPKIPTGEDVPSEEVVVNALADKMASLSIKTIEDEIADFEWIESPSSPTVQFYHKQPIRFIENYLNGEGPSDPNTPAQLSY